MEAKTIIGAVLITLGVVVLAYAGISFTTPGEPIHFFGIHIETVETHFIPPVAGALALVGGIVLLLLKPRSI